MSIFTDQLIQHLEYHHGSGYNPSRYAELFGAVFIEPIPYDPDVYSWHQEYYYNSTTNKLYERKSNGVLKFWGTVEYVYRNVNLNGVKAIQMFTQPVPPSSGVPGTPSTGALVPDCSKCHIQ